MVAAASRLTLQFHAPAAPLLPEQPSHLQPLEPGIQRFYPKAAPPISMVAGILSRLVNDCARSLQRATAGADIVQRDDDV